MLIAAKKQGIIEELKPLIILLKENGVWMHERLISEVLKLAGEDS